MVVKVITAYREICTSQYHQDWRITEQSVIGVFTDDEAFQNAWSKKPKTWREIEKEKYPDREKLYAEEGEENNYWDWSEFELNVLSVS